MLLPLSLFPFLFFCRNLLFIGFQVSLSPFFHFLSLLSNFPRVCFFFSHLKFSIIFFLSFFCVFLFIFFSCQVSTPPAPSSRPALPFPSLPSLPDLSPNSIQIPFPMRALYIKRGGGRTLHSNPITPASQDFSAVSKRSYW